MVPLAPPRLSTITDWPSRFCISTLIVRAIVSLDPPGGNGTTSVIGFSGNAASATFAPRVSAASAMRARIGFFIKTIS